jgi:CDP-diacylglycerol--serine O-phosphatidyltransferase
MSESEQHELTFPGTHVTNHRRRRGIYILPSFFTVGNLLCGYYAVLAVLTGGNGHLDNAAKAIGIAILFDAFDGFVARLAGATSEFGKQFDSLADVISFGIAPAALAYAWGVHALAGDTSSPVRAVQEIAWLVCLAFAICCAWRLARFNVQGMSSASGMRYFVGMPTPAAAGAIAAIVHFLKDPLESWHFAAGFLTVVALLAALMTSTVRYPSLKGVNWGRRHDSLTIILMGLFLWCVIFYSQYTLILLASAYCISGPIIYVIRAVRHRVSPPSAA